MITLRDVSKDNYKALLLLEVSVEQEKYVSSISKSLASAYVYRDCIYPFAIYNGEELIGFIMTRYNQEYNNHFIWQFMIDKKYQKKGYGTKAIVELIDWIISHFDCPNIITTVIEGNMYVEQMYKKLGFKQMGELENGETDFILKVEEYKASKV
jgi:diamine N-acetyltransferase